MSLTYRACGLTVQSNRLLPGLVEISEPQGDAPGADLTIRIHAGDTFTPNRAAELWYESPTDDAGKVLRVWRGADDWRFEYSDGAEFLISDTGARIDASWPADLTDEGAAIYLLGPVMGWALRLRGTVCLHACAVATDAGCFAVVAAAGHSKSTTAAACARRGAPVLTDDLLPLSWRDDRFYALPTYPRIRLWPDSVAGLFGSPDALPRITPGDQSWDKCYLDLNAPGFHFEQEARPLTAIYTGSRDEAASTPVIEPLPVAEALVQLSANAYSHSLLDGDMRAAELDVLSRLVQQVPAYRFRIRRGIEHLDALSELLCNPSTPHYA